MVFLKRGEYYKKINPIESLLIDRKAKSNTWINLLKQRCKEMSGKMGRSDYWFLGQPGSPVIFKYSLFTSEIDEKFAI